MNFKDYKWMVVGDLFYIPTENEKSTKQITLPEGIYDKIILEQRLMKKSDQEAFLRELLDIISQEMPYKGLIAKEMPLNKLYWKIRNKLEGVSP